jgi:hypothetical protein
MKNLNAFTKRRVAQVAALLAAGLITMEQANAALSTAIATTLTGIQTDGLALVDLVWPVVGAITGAFILFKLFKRGSAKI